VPLLYRTTDAAFAQAAVDALLKRGIDAYATGSAGCDLAAYAKGSAQFRMIGRKAGDAGRAAKILARLGAAPADAPRRAPPRWAIWTAVLVVLLLAVFVAGNAHGA
jgi:hypothetical protein